MRLFIKIFLMFTLITSSLASEAFAATNVTKIEETAKSIFVELSKAKELGTVDKYGTETFIYFRLRGGDTSSDKIYGEQVSDKKFRFNRLPTDGCYTLVYMKDEYAKRVALKVYSRVPAQKETVLTPKKQEKYWCYTSKIRSNIFDLQEKIEVAESMLSAAGLGLSRSLEKDNTYDPFCSNPYPLIAPPPKGYCSVPHKLEKRERQCLAPILKTGCNLSLDELVELENQALDKAATPLVCMELTNAALDKATTTGDIVGSMAQSGLLSFNGKKGRLADIGVSLLAYARFEGCMGNIDYDCNPRAPAPPDCSAWEENQSAKAVWIGQENEAKDLLIQYKSEVSVLSKRREVQVY